MKVSVRKIESYCRSSGSTVSQMLREAGVSPNAFYTLARKNCVVPRSLMRIADWLDVPVSSLLEEAPAPAQRVRELLREAARIAGRHPDADPDNVRHTLLLLDEEPVDRLRRALQRAQPIHLR